jgi:hypothetical protein
MGGLDGKQVHRRRRIAALASPAVAAAQTSKNRVSSIWRKRGRGTTLRGGGYFVPDVVHGGGRRDGAPACGRR